MNFQAMKDELKARGFDYIDSDRRTVLVNAAIDWVINADLWPWRIQTVTGQADNADYTYAGAILGIADGVGPIVEVYTDIGGRTVLEARSMDEYLNYKGDYTAGDPQFYALLPNLGVGFSEIFQIAVWPASGAIDPVTAHYYTTGGGDHSTDIAQIMPAHLHYLCVDRAVCMAYRDADNHEAANLLQAEIDKQLQQERMNMITTSGPAGFVRPTECW